MMTAATGKNRAESHSRRIYGIFLCGAVAMSLLLMAVGYAPTLGQGGEEAVRAMVAGCLASLLGAVAGSLPILLSGGRPIPERMPAVFASIGLRLVVVLGAALALALSGAFAVKPLLLWVVIAHAGLLLVDSTYTVKDLRAPLAPRAVEET